METLKRRTRLDFIFLVLIHSLTTSATAATGADPIEIKKDLRDIASIRSFWAARAENYLSASDDLSIATGAYIAGEFQIASTVPILIRKIDFSATGIPNLALWPWKNAACQEALIKIGKPASKEIIKLLGKEIDSKRQEMFVVTIAAIETDEVAELMITREIKRLKSLGDATTHLDEALVFLKDGSR